MKVSHVHAQHVLEFDFLHLQPIHPTAHLCETRDHLHITHNTAQTSVQFTQHVSVRLTSSVYTLWSTNFYFPTNLWQIQILKFILLLHSVVN